MSTLRNLWRRLRGKRPKGEKLDGGKALANLVDARAVLDNIGMRCWLTDGTLLGYYREGDFLGHDLDVDVGCFIDELNEAFLPAFINDGWKCERIYGKWDTGLEVTLAKRGTKVDFFFFYRDSGKWWHAAWRHVGDLRNMIRYEYAPFELKTVKFKGHDFEIPSDTERYVETKYGPGWRQPVKNWDWAFGPANAVATDVNMPDARPDKHKPVIPR